MSGISSEDVNRRWLENRRRGALLEVERQQRIALDPVVRKLAAIWLFDAMGDDCPENHRALDGGIAPMEWSGWRRCAPPLNEFCNCTLVGITLVRARKLLALPGYFDLTNGIPKIAGLDEGYTRPAGSIYGAG